VYKVINEDIQYSDMIGGCRYDSSLVNSLQLFIVLLTLRTS